MPFLTIEPHGTVEDIELHFSRKKMIKAIYSALHNIYDENPILFTFLYLFYRYIDSDYGNNKKRICQQTKNIISFKDFRRMIKDNFSYLNRYMSNDDQSTAIFNNRINVVTFDKLFADIITRITTIIKSWYKIEVNFGTQMFIDWVYDHYCIDRKKYRIDVYYDVDSIYSIFNYRKTIDIVSRSVTTHISNRNKKNYIKDINELLTCYISKDKETNLSYESIRKSFMRILDINSYETQFTNIFDKYFKFCTVIDRETDKIHNIIYLDEHIYKFYNDVPQIHAHVVKLDSSYRFSFMNYISLFDHNYLDNHSNVSLSALVDDNIDRVINLFKPDIKLVSNDVTHIYGLSNIVMYTIFVDIMDICMDEFLSDNINVSININSAISLDRLMLHQSAFNSFGSFDYVNPFKRLLTDDDQLIVSIHSIEFNKIERCKKCKFIFSKDKESNEVTFKLILDYDSNRILQNKISSIGYTKKKDDKMVDIVDTSNLLLIRLEKAINKNAQKLYDNFIARLKKFDDFFYKHLRNSYSNDINLDTTFDNFVTELCYYYNIQQSDIYKTMINENSYDVNSWIRKRSTNAKDR